MHRESVCAIRRLLRTHPRPALASSLVLLAVSLSLTEAAPATAGDDAFSFEDGRAPAQLVVPQPGPGSAAHTNIMIVNDRNTVVAVDLHLDPLRPDTAPAAVYGPEFARLKRGGRHSIQLEFESGPSTTIPGTYKTELVVRGLNAARATVLRKDVVVVVRPMPEIPDVPVVVQRATPFSGHFSEQIVVAGVLPERAGKATLADKDGDVIEVRAAASPLEGTGSSVVTLTAEGLSPGAFRGTVPLGDAGAIDVAVHIEDPFWWLLLVLLAGTFAAYVAERLMAVRGFRREKGDGYRYWPRPLISMSTLVVVVLGLLVLYSRGPFGSALDYTVGLAWGLVGKIVADRLMSLVNHAVMRKR